MAYVPNPTDASQPVESVLAQTAAAEFRALKAYVQSIVSGGGLGVATPGQIAMFPGTVAPPGWLLCDGSLQLRSSFTNLYNAAVAMNAVTSEATWNTGYWGYFSSGDLASNFRLPDMRGMFPRAWNAGKVGGAYDPSRSVGLLQQPTLVFNNAGNLGSVSISPITTNSVFQGDETVPSGSIAYNQMTPASTANTPVNLTSVRPINIALQFCVKT